MKLSKYIHKIKEFFSEDDADSKLAIIIASAIVLIALPIGLYAVYKEELYHPYRNIRINSANKLRLVLFLVVLAGPVLLFIPSFVTDSLLVGAILILSAYGDVK
jgi:hypothetical protein